MIQKNAVLTYNNQILTFDNKVLLGRKTFDYPSTGIVERWEFNNTLEGLNGNKLVAVGLSPREASYGNSDLADFKWMYMDLTGNVANWSYYQCPSLNNFNVTNTDFSISFWAKGLENDTAIITKGLFNPTGDAVNGVIGIWKDASNSIGLQIYGDPSTCEWQSIDNVYTHYVFTYEYSTRKVNYYMNGNWIAPTKYHSIDPCTYYNGSYWYLGALEFQVYPQRLWYNWVVDRYESNLKFGLLYIYNKILSPDEIGMLYNYGDGI
jgi:hypothetical protein